jgi:hypothetical protein
MITLCDAYCLLIDNVLLNYINTHMALNKQTHRYVNKLRCENPRKVSN